MNEVYLIVNNQDYLVITNSIQPWIEYIKSKPKITRLDLSFRMSHTENVALEEPAYYIALGGYGYPGANNEINGDAVMIGRVRGNRMLKAIWKIPEITYIDTVEDELDNYREKPNYYGITV